MSSAVNAVQQPPANDIPAIDELREVCRPLKTEPARVIVGLETVIEQLVICLSARGHLLLMGVPGLARALVARQDRTVVREHLAGIHRLIINS